MTLATHLVRTYTTKTLLSLPEPTYTIYPPITTCSHKTMIVSVNHPKYRLIVLNGQLLCLAHELDMVLRSPYSRTKRKSLAKRFKNALQRITTELNTLETRQLARVKRGLDEVEAEYLPRLIKNLDPVLYRVVSLLGAV